MFDYVDFEMKCPGCGAKVNGFQSKDGGCTLSTLKPTEVNSFYDSCDKCGGWIEFNRHEAKSIVKDFEMTFAPKEKP